MFGFSVYQLLWYFFIYAVLGWCVEVIFCTATTGQWVNRGFLNGPLCPIYGFGMVIVLLCLIPLQGSLPLLFLGSFLLTSALELVTGFVLKKAFHTTWWDYSDQPFNLGGYVCLGFSLAWGLGGMAAVSYTHLEYPVCAARRGRSYCGYPQLSAQGAGTGRRAAQKTCVL